MNEFKQKLEETLNRLYRENQLSIDAYSELMEFADPNQNSQLQQAGVSGSVLKENKCNYAMPDCKHCALANCIYLNDGGL